MIIIPNIRTLIEIGGVNINLYGLTYFLAFLSAFFIFRNYLKKKNKNLYIAYDLSYMVIGMLLFSRIFYFLFYNPSLFLSKPIEFFYFWNGGMSFYGSAVGLILSGLYVCKKNSLDLYEFAVRIILIAIPFLIIGRIVNLFLNEIYGTITSLPFCFNFLSVAGCRHPFQLYSAFAIFLIYLLIIYLYKNKINNKLIFFSFLILHSLFEFLLEFFKFVDYRLFYLSTGQYLSLIFLVVSTFMLIKERNKSGPLPY